MTDPKLSPEHLQHEIMVRCWEDPEFRGRLQKDPKAALKSIGLDLGDKVNIVLAEQQPGTLVLTVPMHPAGYSKNAPRNALKDGLTESLYSVCTNSYYCTKTVRC
jgi:hypothetical protein